MKCAEANLGAVGQISFWVFTLPVSGHMFRSDRNTQHQKSIRAVGGKAVRGEANQSPSTDSVHVIAVWKGSPPKELC